ncbi:hypothetical protein EF908_36900, partial [Streptomyces sp. WAC04770]
AVGRARGVFVPYAAGSLDAWGPLGARPLALGALEPGRACPVHLPQDRLPCGEWELTAPVSGGGTARVARFTVGEDGEPTRFNY